LSGQKLDVRDLQIFLRCMPFFTWFPCHTTENHWSNEKFSIDL